MNDSSLNKGGIILVAATLAVGGYLIGAKTYNSSLVVPASVREKAEARLAYENGRDNLAFNLYSKLAKQGDVVGQYRLGDMYEYGLGTKVNAKQAISWLSKAANAGNVDAARQLGQLYLDGNITVQDFTKARQWLNQAAMAGDATALRRLGEMSAAGLGAPADPVAAYSYYEVATMRSDGNGVLLRDSAARKLNAQQQLQGEQMARDLLKKIANNDHPKAKASNASGGNAAAASAPKHLKKSSNQPKTTS